MKAIDNSSEECDRLDKELLAQLQAMEDWYNKLPCQVAASVMDHCQGRARGCPPTYIVFAFVQHENKWRLRINFNGKLWLVTDTHTYAQTRMSCAKYIPMLLTIVQQNMEKLAKELQEALGLIEPIIAAMKPTTDQKK